MGGLSGNKYNYDGFNRLKSASVYWEGKREIHRSNVEMNYNNTHGIVSKNQEHNVFNVYTTDSQNTDNQYDALYRYNTATHQIESIFYQNFGSENLVGRQDLRYDANGNLIKSRKIFGNENQVREERNLYWDAKDQLQAVIVGNQVSYYDYDYTGNRVIKSLGESQSFAVNGAFNANLSVVDSYILYPNQYITIEQSGNFTKHYYSGSEKIASAIGAGIRFDRGDSAYRTQFERNVRGLFANVNYDAPQFFDRANPDEQCQRTLYYLIEKYERERNRECIKQLDKLKNSDLTPCEILFELEKIGCYRNCDKDLEAIKYDFEKQKNEECLKLIQELEKNGVLSCEIIDILYEKGCLKQECLEEYRGWINFLEEHRRYDCLGMLLDYVQKSGMGMCEAVKYMEEHSDCFDVEVIEDCYKEFLSAYQDCLEMYGRACAESFEKYYLEAIAAAEITGSIDYCDLIKVIIRPPVRPTPPVVLPEPPTPDEGSADSEIDPVVPDPPVIPELPYRPGKIWWYHSDHLGSSSYLTDINGIPTHYYGYLPFGELMVEHNNSNYDNVYKFNGKEIDPQTGYYYYGARYYDPTMSIFLSVDPLAEKMPNYNPYVYTLNNPINYTDPDGRAPESIKITNIKGKDGSQTMNVVITGKIIDLTASGNVHLPSYSNKIKSNLEKSLSGGFTANDGVKINVNVQMDLSIANKVSDIGDNDHVIGIVDSFTPTNSGGIISNKAGIAEMDGNVTLLKSSYLNGFNTVEEHEFGHLMGLDHKGSTFMSETVSQNKTKTDEQQSQMFSRYRYLENGNFRNANRDKLNSDSSKSGLKDLLRVSKAKYDNGKL
ncbi:RHS repeat-associated core domain-containing protein [Myroides sp. DW712]|uniref:RHS repeat-associated core domain-containing protein n=1 Tax=Myroides sp. DW712 TaxID=3389800 RepID=UPI00397927F6